MTYHDPDGRLSNSMLGVLADSPKKFKATYIDRTLKREETKQMRIGLLTHCITLEMDLFADRYAIAPEVDRRTKLGKEAWQQFQDYAALGRSIVDLGEYETAERCSNAILAHPELAAVYRRDDNVIEERIDFEWYDVPCKAKPDLLNVGLGVIIDVKTTQDASPDAFARSVEKFGYHRQAAFYREAAKQRYGKDFRFLFAVVSTNAPHDVAVYELDERSLEIGRGEVHSLLHVYKLLLQSNTWWPAWSRGVVELSLSKWHKSKVYEEDDE